MHGKYPVNNTWVPMPPPNDQNEINIFRDVARERGSDLIKSELEAYQKKLFDYSCSAYVRRNIISSYFPNPQYYFQLNEQYMKNKLKLIMLVFLHKRHWIRTSKVVEGNFVFEPPIYDINAPDLYIPFTAFGPYVILSCFFLGINGKFSPEALCVHFTNGLLCWLLQVLLLEATLQSLGGGEVAVLDVVAYSGYTFVAGSTALLARTVWSCSFYVLTLWESICMGVLFVKTMKRILIAEVTSSERHSSKCHYLLLLVALAQAPLVLWLGSVGH